MIKHRELRSACEKPNIGQIINEGDTVQKDDTVVEALSENVLNVMSDAQIYMTFLLPHHSFVDVKKSPFDRNYFIAQDIGEVYAACQPKNIQIPSEWYR